MFCPFYQWNQKDGLAMKGSIVFLPVISPSKTIFSSQAIRAYIIEGILVLVLCG